MWGMMNATDFAAVDIHIVQFVTPVLLLFLSFDKVYSWSKE